MNPPFLYWFVILTFLSSLSLFVKIRFHFISMLLAIEFMALVLYISILSFPHSLLLESFHSFFFISVVVCESALGLSLVILLSRSKGNDLLAYS